MSDLAMIGAPARPDRYRKMSLFRNGLEWSRDSDAEVRTLDDWLLAQRALFRILHKHNCFRKYSQGGATVLSPGWLDRFLPPNLVIPKATAQTAFWCVFRRWRGAADAAEQITGALAKTREAFGRVLGEEVDYPSDASVILIVNIIRRMATNSVMGQQPRYVDEHAMTKNADDACVFMVVYAMLGGAFDED